MQKNILIFLLSCTTGSMLSGCFISDFFKKKSSDGQNTAGTSGAPVLGQSIGSFAGTRDDAALAEVYSVTTTVAPAPIRPDPDVAIRQMLRQYRPEGATIAREIGRVEQFKLLLGGASQDFKTPPQESYDATSVLANLKVAEEVCKGLIAPNADDQPGWASILPAPPSDLPTNLKFLSQRFIGLPSARIADDVINRLQDIVEETHKGGAYENEDYIPACMALSIDSQALFL